MVAGDSNGGSTFAETKVSSASAIPQLGLNKNLHQVKIEEENNVGNTFNLNAFWWKPTLLWKCPFIYSLTTVSDNYRQSHLWNIGTSGLYILDKSKICIEIQPEILRKEDKEDICCNTVAYCHCRKSDITYFGAELELVGNSNLQKFSMLSDSSTMFVEVIGFHLLNRNCKTVREVKIFISQQLLLYKISTKCSPLPITHATPCSAMILFWHNLLHIKKFCRNQENANSQNFPACSLSEFFNGGHVYV